MPQLSLHSPIGELTLFEQAGAIVALDWGRGSECEPDPTQNENHSRQHGEDGDNDQVERPCDDHPNIQAEKQDKGQGPSPLLERARAQLNQYFIGKRQAFDLPLAPHATSFQQRAFDAMLAIPYAQTCSYGALAHHLSTHARALAMACAANPIPIIIPCHRVIGAGGALGGYSGAGGVATKRFLLALEGAVQFQPTLF
jgi:methylated-DNA-[protein]-cysteine S-methyltransferase